MDGRGDDDDGRFRNDRGGSGGRLRLSLPMFSREHAFPPESARQRFSPWRQRHSRARLGRLASLHKRIAVMSALYCSWRRGLIVNMFRSELDLQRDCPLRPELLPARVQYRVCNLREVQTTEMEVPSDRSEEQAGQYGMTSTLVGTFALSMIS
jgi:hypothetical protein